jgi:hypothetical protein
MDDNFQTTPTLFTETDTPTQIRANIFETFAMHQTRVSDGLWLFITNAHRARYKGAVLQIRAKLPEEIEELEDEQKRDWITAQKPVMDGWKAEFEAVGIRAKLEYRGCCGEACFNCEIFKK